MLYLDLGAEAVDAARASTRRPEARGAETGCTRGAVVRADRGPATARGAEVTAAISRTRWLVVGRVLALR